MFNLQMLSQENVETSKDIQRAVILLSRVARSESFVKQYNFGKALIICLKKGSFFVKFLTKLKLKLGKMIILKMTKLHFQRALYHKPNVCVTSICYYFVGHCAYYAH